MTPQQQAHELRGLIPEGYALVPVEPTEAMIEAACDATFGSNAITPEDAHRVGYLAMLSAHLAPPQPQPTGHCTGGHCDRQGQVPGTLSPSSPTGGRETR